jgi:simple sugar transport system permease protein
VNFPIAHAAVTIMTPVLYAALGGLFTELAGTLNIALEGLLLTAAFAANTAAYGTGSVALGALAGMLAAMLLAAIQGAVVLKLRANVFIAGLAANLFAQGTSVILSRRIFGTRGVVALPDPHPPAAISLPGVRDIPLLGDLLSGHSLYVYASWVLVLAAWAALYRTPWGFRLRAAGAEPGALASLGLRPERCQFAAYLLSGLACGAGGSILALNLGAFVPNMSAGRGWIALVVIFLGGRKPQGLIPAAFVFGLAESVSNYAQGALNIPADFILAIPYFFTLAGMIGVSVLAGRRNRVI